MQLTQSATHNAADTAKVDFPDVAELSAQLLIMFMLFFVLSKFHMSCPLILYIL